MAWLERRGDRFYLCFRLGEQKFKRSLKTTNQREAEAAVCRVERRLKLIEDGDLSIPDDADLTTFILSDGKRERPVVVHAMTLRELLLKYESRLRVGTLEANSIATIKLHLKHIARIFGTKLRADRLRFSDLQNYVDVRSLEQGKRGRPLSAVTVKKELASLSGVWNWAARMGDVRGVFPNKGLSYHKTTEKPMFQTRSEIERQIAKGACRTSNRPTLGIASISQQTTSTTCCKWFRKSHCMTSSTRWCCWPHTPGPGTARSCGRCLKTSISTVALCDSTRRSVFVDGRRLAPFHCLIN